MTCSRCDAVDNPMTNFTIAALVLLVPSGAGRAICARADLAYLRLDNLKVIDQDTAKVYTTLAALETRVAIGDHRS